MENPKMIVRIRLALALIVAAACHQTSVRDLAQTPATSDSAWTMLESGDPAISISPSTISRAGAAFEVWIRLTYQHEQIGQIQEKSFRFNWTNERERIDCRAMRSGTIRFSEYGFDGRVANTYDFGQPDMRGAVPGTIGESVIRSACAYIAAHPDLVR